MMPDDITLIGRDRKGERIGWKEVHCCVLLRLLRPAAFRSIYVITLLSFSLFSCTELADASERPAGEVIAKKRITRMCKVPDPGGERQRLSHVSAFFVHRKEKWMSFLQTPSNADVAK